MRKVLVIITAVLLLLLAGRAAGAATVAAVSDNGTNDAWLRPLTGLVCLVVVLAARYMWRRLRRRG